jgi:hypothetical protein
MVGLNAAKVEKRARQLAKEDINKNRAQQGMPPINRISPQWWKRFGKDYITKAAEEVLGKKRLKLSGNMVTIELCPRCHKSECECDKEGHEQL